MCGSVFLHSGPRVSVLLAVPGPDRRSAVGSVRAQADSSHPVLFFQNYVAGLGFFFSFSRNFRMNLSSSTKIPCEVEEDFCDAQCEFR